MMTAQELELLGRLAQGETIIEAARALSIPARTAYRWVHKPEVAQALEKARLAAWAAIEDQLCDAAFRAVGVIASLMDNADERSAIRLQAASKVLDLIVRTKELTVEARLAALEQRLPDVEE